MTAILDPDEVRIARAEAKELWDALVVTDEHPDYKADLDSRNLRTSLTSRVLRLSRDRQVLEEEPHATAGCGFRRTGWCRAKQPSVR